MPKISIVIPCYNVENYIDKCLSSVINQSEKDFEAILINDGSTDNTLEKCTEWKKKDGRIIIVSKENEGQGIARNIGVKLAKSEYVTFLDADDWLDENYLYEMIIGTQNFTNDLVICDFNFVNQIKSGYDIRTTQIRLPNGVVDLSKESYILSKARTQLWAKLYKKNLLIENKIKKPVYKYEDIAITPLIVAKARSIYHINKPLYFYLKNRQDSAINYFPNLKYLFNSLIDLKENFQNNGIFEKYRTEIRRIFWGELCFLYRMLDTKFSDNDEKTKEEFCRKCDNVVYKNFPELKFISEQKFYVNDNLVKEGLNCIIPQKNQICKDLTDADYLIFFKDKLLNENFNGDIIFLNTINKNIYDKEKLVWDIADEIYNNLTNRSNYHGNKTTHNKKSDSGGK